MIYVFEDFELDVQHYELRQRGEVRPIPRKSFDLLRFLLANAGRVVEKEEIFEAIWPSLSVSENVLPVTIRTVRRAIDDDRGRVLRTIRSRGYTIVCPVHERDVERAGGHSRGSGRAFVGRERLMGMLEEQFAATHAGDGQVVLLYGDPGIGKSRVLQEFARWARTRTPYVFAATCRGGSGSPAYWPLTDLIAQAERISSCRTTRRGSDTDAVERVRAASAGLLDRRLTRGLSAAEVRFRFVGTVMRLLQELSREQPVVLMLDDLHLAEEDTLHVIQSLARDGASERILIVASYRDAEVGRGEPAYLLASISQGVNVERLSLRGLEVDAIEPFVQAEAGVEIRHEVAKALYEKTEGNPFFLRETVRWLMQEGQLRSAVDLSDVGLPASVRDAILRRLDGLSEQCKQVLGWAAVAGRSFTVPLLAQVTELGSESILQRLGEAENARIISSREPGGPLRPPGEYGFAHPLIAETLYQQVSAPERVRRHRAVALALEALVGRSSSDRLEELAHHYFQAAPAGEVDRATFYSRQSASRALEALSYDDAIRHLRNALVAEELRVPRDDLRYGETLVALAEALALSGHHEEAEPIFQRAADLGRKLGEASLLSRAALGLAGEPFRSREGDGGSREPGRSSAELLEEAHSLLGEGNVDSRSRVLAALARRSSIEPSVRGDYASRAVELAREGGSPEALFDALMAQLQVLQTPDTIQERLTLANEAAQLAASLHAKPLVFRAQEARIPLLFSVGEMALADRSIDLVARLADQLGVPAYSYTAARFQLSRRIGNGDLDGARKALENVMSLGRTAGDPAIGWLAGAIGLWLLSMDVGSDNVTQALSALMSQEYMEGPAADSFAAHFHMAMGDRAGCARWFDQAAQDDFSRYPFDQDWLWNLNGLADVSLFLEDHVRAPKLYELLLPYENLNVLHRSWTYRGSLALTLGRVALALGDPRRARGHMERALAFNRKLGACLPLLFSRYFYAAVLDCGSPQDRREAHVTRKEVVAEAGRLGLRWLFDKRP